MRPAFRSPSSRRAAVHSAVRAVVGAAARVAAGAVAALTLAAGAAAAQGAEPDHRGDEYTAPRDADVDARGARRLRVESRAGFLRVRGVDGLAAVRVRGTARASRRATLDEIRLTARREGDAVVVLADIPDRSDDARWRGGWDGDDVRALDLTLEVPRGIAADVVDGSGALEIRGVGALDVKDGSGEITIEDVGPTRVEDGSGEIRVSDVRGDLRVADGSGSIGVRRVRGSVIVERGGSGGIDVRDVDGDLTVERGRARSLDHAGVRGRVTVPADERVRPARRMVWY
jgi:hypothetical protein